MRLRVTVSVLIACRDESIGTVVVTCMHRVCINVSMPISESSLYYTSVALPSSNIPMLGHTITVPSDGCEHQNTRCEQNGLWSRPGVKQKYWRFL